MPSSPSHFAPPSPLFSSSVLPLLRIQMETIMLLLSACLLCRMMEGEAGPVPERAEDKKRICTAYVGNSAGAHAFRCRTSCWKQRGNMSSIYVEREGDMKASVAAVSPNMMQKPLTALKCRLWLWARFDSSILHQLCDTRIQLIFSFKWQTLILSLES